MNFGPFDRGRGRDTSRQNEVTEVESVEHLPTERSHLSRKRRNKNTEQGNNETPKTG